MKDSDPIIDEVSQQQAEHYHGLLQKYGASVDAVASARQEYKDLRYKSLSSVFERDKNFSLHEIGFGLGHYYEYLKTHFADRAITFTGSEVTPVFLQHCLEKYPDCEFDNHDYALQPSQKSYDYIVLPGVFYQLGTSDPHKFSEFVHRMLINAWKSARRGLAFNMISSQVNYRYDHLFYADPSEMLAFVSRHLSRFLHFDQASPLFEFTICVYRSEYIKSEISNPFFSKYFRDYI
jgi:hypothetical protein